MLLQLLRILGVAGLTVLPCIMLIAVLSAPRQLITAHIKELQPLIIRTCVELTTSSLPKIHVVSYIIVSRCVRV